MVGYVVGYKSKVSSIPDPLGGAVEWEKVTDHIPCTYKDNLNDTRGTYEEGKFKRHSFEVIVDESFLYKDSQLFDYHKNPITKIVKIQGEPRYLDVLCKTKRYV